MGDLLLVPVCGAYTSASATTFNGFKKARIVVWEEVQAELGLEKCSWRYKLSPRALFAEVSGRKGFLFSGFF